MILWVGIFLIIAVIGAIFRGVFHATRTKLENENEKVEYLSNQFDFLTDLSFNKDNTFSNHETLTEDEKKVCLTFTEINHGKRGGIIYGIEKGTIDRVRYYLPKNEKKPWQVIVTVKYNPWGFTNSEMDIEIYNIMDDELSTLISGNP